MEIKISEDLDWMIHDQLNDLEIFVACFFGWWILSKLKLYFMHLTANFNPIILN